ncbi:MAG: DEAD/DEAH box helicase [Saprospiraceae bacterium]
METFKELGLSEGILKALGDMGFETPTGIQAKAIPQLLEKDPDMIGLAQTGTGKTAAFGLPLLDLLDPDKRSTQAVILAPTRELVQQIANEFKNFSKYLKRINITVVYGGTAIYNQIKEIKRATPHIIIATPGRLIDLIGRRVVNLDSIDHLVLDEADEMLNMGFQEDIDKILVGTPDEKRTWLFSATMPKEIRHIVNTYMTDPIEVSIDRSNVTNQNISHKYVLVNRRDKAEAVKRVIDYIPELYGVIFCRTKMDTQDLADELSREGYRAEAIHGDLSQGQRDKVMSRFRNGRINILVATDVAARGIDVNNLTHVIHYTLPDSPAYYTHRSGRTARAGKSGISLTILIPKDKSKMRQISRALKIDFEKVLLPKQAELLTKRVEKWTDKLKEADETELPVGMLDRVMLNLEGLDAETIIAKLLAQQMKKIQKKKGIKDDLNLEESGRDHRDGGRKRDRDRGRGRDRDDRGRGRRDRDDRGRGDRKRDDRGGDRRDDRRDRRSESFDRSDRRSSRDRDTRRDDRGGDRRERKEGRTEGTKRTYEGKKSKMFINIGKVDKMSSGELLDYISKNGNVKRKSIGDISMSKMHTVFELDRAEVRSASTHFKNIQLKGRPIRCNEE